MEARQLLHRPVPSTNTRSTYGDNYRAPYTFIRGVHLAQIPGAREREIKSRGPEFRPQILLAAAQVSGNTNGTTIAGYKRVHNRYNRPRTTFPVSCYSCARNAQLPLHVAFYLWTGQFACNREIYAVPVNTAGTVTFFFAELRTEGKTLARPSSPAPPSFCDDLSSSFVAL